MPGRLSDQNGEAIAAAQMVYARPVYASIGLSIGRLALEV